MECHKILDLTSQLQLSGMRAAYDGIVTGASSQLGLESVISALLQAEIAAKQARSINYQMTLAKMPLVKETANLAFEGSPVNGALIEQLSSCSTSSDSFTNANQTSSRPTSPSQSGRRF